MSPCPDRMLRKALAKGLLRFKIGQIWLLSATFKKILTQKAGTQVAPFGPFGRLRTGAQRMTFLEIIELTLIGLAVRRGSPKNGSYLFNRSTFKNRARVLFWAVRRIGAGPRRISDGLPGPPCLVQGKVRVLGFLISGPG
jgi:hypothetical protein